MHREPRQTRKQQRQQSQLKWGGGEKKTSAFSLSLFLPSLLQDRLLLCYPPTSNGSIAWADFRHTHTHTQVYHLHSKNRLTQITKGETGTERSRDRERFAFSLPFCSRADKTNWNVWQILTSRRTIVKKKKRKRQIPHNKNRMPHHSVVRGLDYS